VSERKESVPERLHLRDVHWQKTLSGNRSFCVGEKEGHHYVLLENNVPEGTELAKGIILGPTVNRRGNRLVEYIVTRPGSGHRIKIRRPGVIRYQRVPIKNAPEFEHVKGMWKETTVIERMRMKIGLE
jgi:hypothetical protein